MEQPGVPEDVYRKKLEELQQAREAELQRRSVLRQLLEPAAYERLSNIRMSNAELYLNLSSLVIMLFRRGELKGKLSEEQLKQLAARLLGGRRETTIRRV
ncbi:MAG: DNA-binding protein [Candidatus Micrarchaeota archaeon]